MWLLFRTHLFINGVIALRNNNVKKLYQKEYIYWINTIKKDRNKLLKSRIVPLKSKVRIIAILYFPELWGKLAKLKRVVIFKKSV